VAIEGGYFIFNNKYYIVDVACIKDCNGYKFGYSDFFEISKNMYDCIAAGISLNDIIISFKDFRESYSEFKQKYGVIGYLSNKNLGRDYGSIQAVKNAVNSEYAKRENFKIDKKNIVTFKNKQFKKLDTACKKMLENSAINVT
jgi:non-canonical (house-cleaning) NTP pyrophosphatase